MVSIVGIFVIFISHFIIETTTLDVENNTLSSDKTYSDIGQWRGFQTVGMFINSHKGFVVVPKNRIPTTNLWIWRTEFFDHEPQVDIELLNKGYHLAYIDVQNMYGAPAAIDVMNQFYAKVVSQFNLSSRTILEGFSRGGLFAFNWAAQNADKVAVIYADNPVLDFKSWPAGLGSSYRRTEDWNRLLAIYNMTEQEAIAYKFNPIDNLLLLAKERVPILCVCGDRDTVVPYNENTGILVERYAQLAFPNTSTLKVIIKERCDHHPHSLKNPQIIVDFIEECVGNNTVNYTIEYIDYCSVFGVPYDEEWKYVLILSFSGLGVIAIIVAILIFSYKFMFTE